MREHVRGTRRAAQHADRARIARAFGGERGRERSERRHEPLESTSSAERRGIRSPCVASTSGSAAAGTARQTSRGRQFELGGAMTLIARGKLDPGQVARVDAAARAAPRPARSVRQPRSTSKPARARHTASAVPQHPAPMIAARRIGGVPPSHSHCSITHGQIRAVTAAASCGEASCTCGKRSGAAGTDPHLVRADPPSAADRLGADHGDRDDRRTGLERKTPDALARLAERAGPGPRPLGEDEHDLAALEQRLGGAHRSRVGRRRDRPGRRRARSGATPASRWRNNSFLAT